MLRLFFTLGALPALMVLAGLTGCSRDLTLPAPPSGRVPVITGFAPRAAFGGETLVVYAEQIDLVGNTLEFPGGQTVLATTSADGGDALVDGGLLFVVPADLSDRGPLVLSNTQGRSEPSGDFAPMGTGHPIQGAPVAQLRFRHNPVGLLDRAQNVLMGSSIFDLVVTDGKAYQRVPGRPLALKRSTDPDRALLSVSIPGKRGMLLEVDGADGAELMRSDESEVRELFILPPFDAVTSIARTIGVNAQGKYLFSTWAVSNGKLVASQLTLPFAEVIGAAAYGAQVSVIARNALDTSFSVYNVSVIGSTRAWSPTTGPSCETPTGPLTECESPDGPVTIVAPVTMGDPPLVVVSLSSGDLLLLSGSSARTIKLISYAPVTALAATTTPGKVLLTKALDGALFQYDLLTEELDWSVQLRGEPSVIDVAASIDEIAVGNRLDNAVDIITASSGAWIGRIAFNLGVGSADGRPGGIVAPYSYDPATWVNDEYPVERMDLLMRNVGLVVALDASSLELRAHQLIDAVPGNPLRLAVTHDYQTLVVHERGLGVLEPDAAGSDERLERRVTEAPFDAVPRDVLVMPEGQVVISWLDRLRWYEWQGSPRMLVQRGELVLPVGTSLLGATADGADVLVTWVDSAGAFGGGFYALSEFGSGSRGRPLNLDGALDEFIGLATMKSGPAAFFLDDEDPRVLGREALRNGSPGNSTVVRRKRVGGTSPDGHFLFWLDEGSAEPMIRLVVDDGSGSLVGYSTYRLAGNAAGPSCDPSGEWLYIPVPLMDQLEVVQ